MKKLLLLSFTAVIATCCSAQFKNDNVLYKTVFTQDLCNELQKQPGYLILDVRSPGEYADTSMMGMNIGRFKDARNINVRELGPQIASLAAYKNKPVFVYCSHSQRSRRASKMLADSGFTNVFNINGGMTGLRQLPLKGNECLYNILDSKNAYSIISATDLCEAINKNSKNIFLLDVRNDSAFRHISTDAKVNAYGGFKNSVHISLLDLEAGKGNIPRDKKIVIIDLFGDDADKAANLLKQKNYPKVSILLEGVDRLLGSNKKELDCFQSGYVSPVQYNIMSAQELKGFMETSRGYYFLDVRTTDEFNNKHKNYWQNIGHIQDAVNIPAADLDAGWNAIESWKTKPVIIYGFGSSTVAYEAANTLTAKGFTNIHVLQGGIFNIGWTAANVKGYSSLASLRVDVPLDNQ